VRPRVYVTRRVPDGGLAPLETGDFDVAVWAEDRALPREVLLDEAARADGLLVQLTERVDEALLAAAPRLRALATASVGVEHLDLAALGRRGIRPSHTPGVLTDATAELAMALLLAAARHVVRGDRLVRSGAWAGFSPSLLLGLELSAATLGIVGPGRIGCALARRARAFGVRLLYSGRRDSPEMEALGAARRPLEDLLRESDAVSLHVPLTPATRHLVGARELALMRPHAVLVNTARGPVVDEAALVAALRAGRPGAAGLDVYEREPALAEGLAALENAVLLPHLGSATLATRRAMALTAATDLARALRGEPQLHPVPTEGDPT
jgi:glyoxylate reductase